jgi:hypothetical protein
MSEPGGGILAIWNDREEAIAQLYEQWYVTEHVPERLGVPGFLEARRYEACDGGSPRFFTYYELASVDVLSSDAYLARLAAPSELTRKVMSHFRNMLRTAFVPVRRAESPARGGCVAVAWVRQPAPVDAALLQQACGELRRQAGVLALHCWRAAPDAGAVSTEAQLRPGGDARAEAAVVLEVMREQEGAALRPLLERALLAACGPSSGAAVATGVFRLLGSWRAAA